MKGPADVGGAEGFGPVVPDPDQDPFHAEWEKTAFGLTIAMGATGLWSLDRSRFMRESLPHTTYYGSSYFEIWLRALERLVAEAQVGSDGEVPPKRVLKQENVRAAMAAGGPTEREDTAPPRFAVGDSVRVKPMRPKGHTRAPAYLHGRVGRVAMVHGTHVFPDTSAHRKGEAPTPLYNIAFDAAELWGKDTTVSQVRADLFEPYLDPA
ncbi:MAG: nitrile hydratase subunit beta [Pseudomonadota bacterium]